MRTVVRILIFFYTVLAIVAAQPESWQEHVSTAFFVIVPLLLGYAAAVAEGEDL